MKRCNISDEKVFFSGGVSEVLDRTPFKNTAYWCKLWAEKGYEDDLEELIFKEVTSKVSYNRAARIIQVIGNESSKNQKVISTIKLMENKHATHSLRDIGLAYKEAAVYEASKKAETIGLLGHVENNRCFALALEPVTEPTIEYHFLLLKELAESDKARKEDLLSKRKQLSEIVFDIVKRNKGKVKNGIQTLIQNDARGIAETIGIEIAPSAFTELIEKECKYYNSVGAENYEKKGVYKRVRCKELEELIKKEDSKYSPSQRKKEILDKLIQVTSKNNRIWTMEMNAIKKNIDRIYSSFSQRRRRRRPKKPTLQSSSEKHKSRINDYLTDIVSFYIGDKRQKRSKDIVNKLLRSTPEVNKFMKYVTSVLFGEDIEIPSCSLNVISHGDYRLHHIYKYAGLEDKIKVFDLGGCKKERVGRDIVEVLTSSFVDLEDSEIDSRHKEYLDQIYGMLSVDYSNFSKAQMQACFALKVVSRLGKVGLSCRTYLKGFRNEYDAMVVRDDKLEREKTINPTEDYSLKTFAYYHGKRLEEEINHMINHELDYVFDKNSELENSLVSFKELLEDIKIDVRTPRGKRIDYHINVFDPDKTYRKGGLFKEVYDFEKNVWVPTQNEA